MRAFLHHLIRRILIFPTLLVASLLGQNLQLHYDIAREQPTSTLEFFQVDQWGAWFTFIDFDYHRPWRHGPNGISAAYWEIARYVNLPVKGRWSATLQYNDGLDKGNFFNPVWLGGLQYLFKVGTLELPVDFLVRRELHTDCWTAQLTIVWQQRTKRWELAGYLDLWNTGAGGYPANRIAFMTEPQVWLYLGDKLAIGSEIEISYNFSGAWSHKHCFSANRLFVLPTLGCKWTF